MILTAQQELNKATLVTTVVTPGQTGIGLRRCTMSTLLSMLYRWSSRIGSHRVMQSIMKMALKLEGGEFFSYTARKLVRQHYQLDIGAYSYGCFDPIRFPDGAHVGRYVSIAMSVRSYRRNHPAQSLSTHPLFFSSRCGASESREMPTSTLFIGHDAWIGAHAVILPGCQHVGIGAIVGAGSVVIRDVDPYTIVAGNPAKPIRKRFDAETIERLLQSRWWENDYGSVQSNLEERERRILEGDSEPWS
jgi:virginiamycin A acetyltransferase